MKKVIFLLIWFIMLPIGRVMAQHPPIAWTDTIDLGDSERAHGVATDPAGNIIVTGYYGNKWFTVKYDPDGKILWTDTTILGSAWGVATDFSGNIIVTGSVTHGSLGSDFITVKYDPDGKILWTDTVDFGVYDCGKGVATDPAGNIIVTGEVMPGGGETDYYTVKYDPDGNVLWTDTIANGKAKAVATDLSGNIIVTGYNWSTGLSDYYTVKYDPDGNILWADRIDLGSDEWAFGVATDPSGNIIVTGVAWDGLPKFYTVKYDPHGNILWTDIIDLGGGRGVATDFAGNIIVTGPLWWSSPYNGDYFTVKYDPDGNILWADTIDLGSDEWAFGVATDPSGSVIVTGRAWFHNEDCYTVKYQPELPQVTVLFPNGGEEFEVGDTCNITWFAAGNGGIDSVSILYSIDAGLSWDTIATGEPNDSLYEWIIPSTPSESCLVKILAYDPGLNMGEDESDSLFRIRTSGVGGSAPVIRPFLTVSPNPFSEHMEIAFSPGDAGEVSLRIYDATGRLVKEFIPPTASTALSWDGRDESGRKVGCGVYFLRFEAGGYQKTEKLLLVQ